MSMEFFELHMAVEDEFGVWVPEERAQKMETVRDLYDYITETLISDGAAVSKSVRTPILMGGGY